MRIIAGTHRGRPLLGPEDDQTTRPITDRVKENLFNRLQSLGVLGYGRVLDLFCGTGSMGLEALSRGAEHCTFVDLDRGAIERLDDNLDALKTEPEAAHVITGSALLPAWTHTTPDGGLTLALIDPPFPMVLDDLSPFYALLDTIRPKLEPGGVAVIRTPAEIEAMDERDGYDGPASITYGKMTLHFYQSPLDGDENDDGGDVQATT
ncbi:MAG: RsmD family RNA methyltransferase [Planctomycetota bacterium]